MCGICGYINYRDKNETNVITKMCNAMAYRGPDDQGDYIRLGDKFEVALGHVRLSILDLSSAGHQPMTFKNYTIVYNGEVYNFKEIKSELESLGHLFCTNCDTEVILHSFDEWGEKCVSKFIGMFVFAIYDSIENRIYICRDRCGIKPLYWYWKDNLFLFASELKSLLAYPGISCEIDNVSKAMFFAYGYIPNNQAIFSNTKKLDAGNWLILNIATKKIEIKKYWDVEDYYKKDKLNISYIEAQEELINLFKSAFKYRLIADVPVGVFLSGGFDSSVVTSILTKELNVRPTTFTIGFHEGSNEAPDAEMISQLLGTNHYTQYCTQQDALELVNELPFYYDEPFSDPSGIPTILLSKFAKQKVSVILSADGGDEVFGGYTEYSKLMSDYNRVNAVPIFIQNNFHYIYKHLKSIVGNRTKYNHILDHLQEYYSKKDKTVKGYYVAGLIHNLKLIDQICPQLNTSACYGVYDDINCCVDSPEFGLVKDYKRTMKDKYLVKVDRATMAVSLEGREPLLDHRIVEFVAQLPFDFKIKNGVKKIILKDIVYRYLPQELMDKPKRGFSVPISSWLRADLRDSFIDSVSEYKLKNMGLDVKAVKVLVDRFMSGDNMLSQFMWQLYQYSSWYSRWMK